MQIVEVDRVDWSPDEKNQRVEELPDGVRLIDGDAILINEERETVAAQIIAAPESSGRLAWFGREMHSKPKVWHDDRHTANASSRLSGVLYPNRTFGTAAPSALRRPCWCSTATFDQPQTKVAAALRN